MPGGLCKVYNILHLSSSLQQSHKAEACKKGLASPRSRSWKFFERDNQVPLSSKPHSWLLVRTPSEIISPSFWKSDFTALSPCPYQTWAGSYLPHRILLRAKELTHIQVPSRVPNRHWETVSLLPSIPSCPWHSVRPARLSDFPFSL